jgi:hypothetical protein
MNQLISSAVGEKLASLLTLDYLRERARLGKRSAYDKVLRSVRDVPSVGGDGLPNKGMQQTKRGRKPSKTGQRHWVALRSWSPVFGRHDEVTDVYETSSQD